jgi:hypothetical protein
LSPQVGYIRLAAARGPIERRSSNARVEAQTVKMAQGIYIYQGSRIRYREAKLAFARCALANDAK